MNQTIPDSPREIELSERDKDELFQLTSVSSFYREEHNGNIGAKQILTPDIPEIRKHLKTHEVCMELIPDFLDGNISLEELVCKLHGELITPSFKIPVPGNLRKSMVVLSRDNNPFANRIKSADFICPNYDKISDGLALVEKKFRDKINFKQNLVTACAELHYLLAVIHPFHDGNGRIARMVSLSLLKHFGFMDILGFTFFSENYYENGNDTVYNNLFKTDKARDLTRSLIEKSKGQTKKDTEGEIIEGIDDIDMQHYIDNLDIESPINSLDQIISKLIIVTPLLIEFSRIIAFMKDNGMTKGKQNFKLLQVILDGVKSEIKNGETPHKIIFDFTFSDIWGKKDIKSTSIQDIKDARALILYVNGLMFFGINIDDKTKRVFKYMGENDGVESLEVILGTIETKELAGGYS